MRYVDGLLVTGIAKGYGFITERVNAVGVGVLLLDSQKVELVST